MLRTLLRSKIHRARVTEADLDYEGSVTIDANLLNAASIAPFERVEIYDCTSGSRLATYAIPGEAGAGEICINGAAAHLVKPNDTVIICCYGEFHENEVESHVAKVILVDENNAIKEKRELPVAESLAG